MSKILLPSTPASKVSSTSHVVVKRARRFLVTPPTVVKLHAIKIFPSGCISTSVTELLAFGLNVESRRPVELTRAIPFLATHCTKLNNHPNTTCPSDCNATALTCPLIVLCDENEVSMRPVFVKRVNFGCVATHPNAK